MPPKRIERFEKKYIPEPNSGCWLWIGSWDGCGYGQFWDGNRKKKAHRFSWEYYNGPISAGSGSHGLCVLHKCDTPSCVNPAHLFLGTQKDNIRDSLRKGRMACGEKLPQTRLTTKQVREIKRLLLTNITQRAIAERFGIDPSTISKINSGKSWNHIT